MIQNIFGGRRTTQRGALAKGRDLKTSVGFGRGCKSNTVGICSFWPISVVQYTIENKRSEYDHGFVIIFSLLLSVTKLTAILLCTSKYKYGPSN